MDSLNTGDLNRAEHLQQQEKVSAADAQTSSTPPSEMGSIGKDIGSVIAQWQNNLHNVLENWYQTGVELQQIIDDIKHAVSIYKNVKNEYNAILNDPKRVQPGKSSLQNRVYDFSSAQVDNVKKLLSFLGIPPSDIRTNGPVSGYAVAITATQYISMFELIQQTIVSKVATGTLIPDSVKSSIQGEVASLKSDQTRDMFKAMVCVNSIRENEHSLSGILNSLKTIESSIYSDIQ